MTAPKMLVTMISLAVLALTSVVSASSNGTAMAVPVGSNATHLSFCRNFGTYHETIVTSVQSKKYVAYLRSLNSTIMEGTCKSLCPKLCNKTSCLAAATLTIMPNGRERCTCPNKCTGLKNVACAASTNTCSCKDGYWGPNMTLSGCPNRGFYVKPIPWNNYSAFEPVLDNATMFIHHQKHHKAYVDALNYALRNSPDLTKPIVALQANAVTAGPTIRHNAGGHYNHALFWSILAPPTIANTTKVSPQLLALMKSSYGNQYNTISAFNKLAKSTIGSNWVWLCINADGTKLVIVDTPNQDNPLMNGAMNTTMFPILGLDVWEHAYYLKYNVMRDTYITNFWKLVNWNRVSEYTAYVVSNKTGVSV